MSSIGTLEWTTRTGGRLSTREQLLFAAEGVASQLAALSDRTARSLGVRRERLGRLDLADLRTPDTAAAREAESVVRDFGAPLRNHSHRTYLWALALADHDDVSYDAELLYCACLLHDAGLAGAAARSDGNCFTLTSAAVADAHAACWPVGRREQLRGAITLHINAGVPLERGPEAYLLAAGATLDGVGRYLWRIDQATRAAVLERHPRLGFKREVDTLLRAEARTVPQGRIAFLYRFGALGSLLARAPFGD